MIENVKSFALLLLLFLIAFEGVFGEYKVGGIGVVRMIEICFFLMVFNQFLNDSRNKILSSTNWIFLIFIILLILKFFTITFIFRSIELDIVLDIIRIITLVIHLYLMFYLIRRNYKNINIIIGFNLLIMFIAFFQSGLTPLTDWAWAIKYDYFDSGWEGFEDSIFFRKRVIGLYLSSIPLAYVLVGNMILGLYMNIKTNKNVYIIYFVFLGLISIFSLTRSVVLSWIVLFLFIIIRYLATSKISIFKKGLFALVVFGILIYSTAFYLDNMSKLERISSVSGDSATGRIPLAITGLYATFRYPMGPSEAQYQNAKLEMFKVFHHHHILDYGSHNGIVNIGLKYSLIGLIAFFIYMAKIRNRIEHSAISTEMRFFFLFAAIAYLVNSIVHNKFFVIDDFYGLVLIALIAYEYDLSLKIKNV